MITKAEFDQWSRSMKRKSLWLGGLRFWQRTNTDSKLLVARHWRHLACWSWSVHWTPYPGKKRYTGKRITFYQLKGNSTYQFSLWLWLGSLNFHKQSNDRLASSRYPDKKINWDREHGRNTIVASIDSWPVQRSAIRLELMKQDYCPECGGLFDTGWECNDCNFDGRSDGPFDDYIKREIANETVGA